MGQMSNSNAIAKKTMVPLNMNMSTAAASTTPSSLICDEEDKYQQITQ